MTKSIVLLILLAISFQVEASNNGKKNINQQELIEEAFDSSMRSHCINELELNLAQLQKKNIRKLLLDSI